MRTHETGFSDSWFYPFRLVSLLHQWLFSLRPPLQLRRPQSSFGCLMAKGKRPCFMCGKRDFSHTWHGQGDVPWCHKAHQRFMRDCIDKETLHPSWSLVRRHIHDVDNTGSLIYAAGARADVQALGPLWRLRITGISRAGFASCVDLLCTCIGHGPCCSSSSKPCPSNLRA